MDDILLGLVRLYERGGFMGKNTLEDKISGKEKSPCPIFPSMSEAYCLQYLTDMVIMWAPDFAMNDKLHKKYLQKNPSRNVYWKYSRKATSPACKLLIESSKRNYWEAKSLVSILKSNPNLLFHKDGPFDKTLQIELQFLPIGDPESDSPSVVGPGEIRIRCQ